VGGSRGTELGYLDLQDGVQEYDFYAGLKRGSDGAPVFSSMPEPGKLRLMEVFHSEPTPAVGQLLDSSNIQNVIATEFGYDSFANTTAYYVLPVFEDILRRGMMEEQRRVRRSNYSYRITGTKIVFFPIPRFGGLYSIPRMWVRYGEPSDPYTVDYEDSSINGSVTGPHDVPFRTLPYSSINGPGRQWIRQYAMALAKELLGLVRSKIDGIPVGDGELKLNGGELVSQAREDKQKLQDELKEFLAATTQSKLAETDAATAENVVKQLRAVPIPRPIYVG
jgi:hypothetical protein